MPRLCAFGCSTNGVNTHVFPNPQRHPAMFRAWVNILGGKIENSDDIQNYRKKRVCDIHFTEAQKTWNNRLNTLAVPTLCLTNIQKPVETDFGTPNQKEYSSGPLHHFPKPDCDPERFQVWKAVLHSNIQEKGDISIYNQLRFCNRHFESYYISPSNRLTRNAIPTLNMNKDESDTPCTNIEYLEEDEVSNGSDDTDMTNMDRSSVKSEDNEAPRKTFSEYDIKLTLDDIDFLLLSYAETFRSFAKQLQTMLKLDLAKLFARYEMKNLSLSTKGKSNSLTPLDQKNNTQLPSPSVPEPQVPAVKPNVDKPSVVIPSKEENFRILRPVPMEEVVSALYAQFTPKEPTRVVSSQVMPEKPTEVIRYIPQIKRLPIPYQQTKPKELETNKTETCLLFESITKKYESPIINLDRLKTNQLQSSAPVETIPPPPPKAMKYYLPKKGPAYAIISKGSLQKQKGFHEPDLEMEVTESIDTESETVFVTTDHASFSENET